MKTNKYTISKMKIFSGDVCKCDVGIPTNELDMHGNRLHTGDIVQLWHGEYIGEEFEQWLPSSGLTAIVADQYKSYYGGKHVLINEYPKPFTMGIASCGVQNKEWKVALVKSYKDIIPGERFPCYGFNYRDNVKISKE
jgi:hypothetical protein